MPITASISLTGFWLTAQILGYVLCAAMVLVVLRRQMATGASLAWLGIVFLHPYVGITLYLLVGETRLGPRRVEQYRKLIDQSRIPDAPDGGAAENVMPAEYRPMVLQAAKISGMPVLTGNSIEFIANADEFVTKLIAEINSAKTSADLLYYIFGCDGTAMRVIEALCAASARGVKCKLLVDAVASRPFLHRKDLQTRLKNAGIEVTAALPVELIRRRLPRMDLRNHRKLAVIDGAIAFAGSHNMINPDYGGRKGGPWVDVTGRFTGPIVDELAIVFREDWAFEKSQEFTGPTRYDMGRAAGDCLMQVAPTGPSAPGDTYRRLLLAAIQCARKQLIITTPYFVPDETTLVSLMMAADRGVDVRLLLPLNPDHFFTAAAGRAHFSKLMDAGIKIFLYRPGLLHAKTTTVDDAFCIFGSANLDVRSFNLNFELSNLLYGSRVTGELRKVQLQFEKDSDQLDPATWARRPTWKSYADGAIALLSPLL